MGPNPDSRDLDVAAMILAITKVLLHQQDCVRLEARPQEHGTAIHVIVDEQAMGKLIGKGGRTIRSMRTLLQAASMAQMRRYSLDITSDISPNISPDISADRTPNAN
jgi:predicted RNA-binding protein YlqC (UPF0109 family)